MKYKRLQCITPEELWSFIVFEPFLAYFFLRSDIQEDSEMEALAAVKVQRGKIHLRINPEIFITLPTRQKIGVIVHEYLHVLLQHCTSRARYKFGAKVLKQNYAMDMAINQLILKRWDLPSWVITHDRFPFDFPPDLTAEQYFDIIDAAYTDEKFQDLFGAEDQLDSHLDWEESAENSASIKEMKKSYLNSFRGSELGDTISAGKLSSDFIERVLATDPEDIGWVVAAKYFLAKTTSHSRIRTYKRPSRRYGFPFQGPKFKQIVKAAAIVDTSASITAKMLSEVGGHLNAMTSIMEVDVLMCDSSVKGEVVKYKATKDLLFKGRGGTNLQPAFDKAKEEGYKCVICFTDGGLEREVESDLQTLWVVINNGKYKPSFGRIHYVTWS